MPSKAPDTAQPLVDVFISYARTDQAIAANLAETLRAEGFEVWFDADIYAGADWKDLLMSTLAVAKAIVVLWSSRSVTRPWVLKEARIALSTRRLVPVKIEDCALPPRFERVQSAMMQGWQGKGPHAELERLLAGLSHMAPPAHIDTVRPGFDTRFLGPELGLPAITGVGEEFRYLHFSVVMNPARRLAWYVAYNMQAHEPAKRGNRWMADPMLPAAFQPANEHFLGTGLDRGHLVAPMSVSWGPPREAQLANYQSFFWTNTAPQHPDMNQRWWLALEEWERQVAATHGKAVGYSGPVLAADDPVHRDFEQAIGRLRVRQNFRLPRRFWKLVVVAGDGTAAAQTGPLRVAAFMLDQDTLLQAQAHSHQRLSMDPDRARCSVADIEALTGLDFGAAIRRAEPLR